MSNHTATAPATCHYCDDAAVATATVHRADRRWASDPLPVCADHSDANAER